MAKSELKKQRIYRATSELIDEKGGNFSLEMVAKKAEMSKAVYCIISRQKSVY